MSSVTTQKTTTTTTSSSVPTGSTTYTSQTTVVAPHREQVVLPTQVIEKPVAIHEEIRTERVEEIQPVINVEKIKTEVHQVTQPLFDKEVRAVNIEQRTLATEILPEVQVQGRGVRSVEDHSTTRVLDTRAVVLEKPAIINEVEKRQVIEEIQPVIYKETIVPTVIQETKPMYQKVVEGAVYTQETMATRGVRSEEEMRLEAQRNAYQPSTQVVAPVKTQMMLPTQVVEKPVAVHEEIRKELIEEIQPVVQVEKLHTEVHQITAPLYDKEIKPVMIEKRTLNTEILPEVQVQGKGFRSVDDVSTTTMLPTSSVVVEKPAIFNEVERTQVIEEVQPVIYMETIVPTVIQETKPMYQKVVEGTVYTQETMAMKGVRSEEEIRMEASRNAYVPSTAVVAPVHSSVNLPTQVVEKPVAVHEEIRREMVEEIQPVINVEKLKTEVHQVTQPLFDKEVRSVNIEQRTLATEILPEVMIEGRGVRAVEDHSTVRVLDTKSVVIEKSAQVIEIEKTQIIEEIQPVIYKETIVPTVIQETKPVFQRVVEGAVYVHETLAPQSVAQWKASHGEFHTSTTTTTSTSTTVIPSGTSQTTTYVVPQ